MSHGRRRAATPVCLSNHAEVNRSRTAIDASHVDQFDVRQIREAVVGSRRREGKQTGPAKAARPRGAVVTAMLMPLSDAAALP